MRLVLTLAEGGSSLPEKDRARILSSSGVPATLSIGRGSDNDWVLPSPEKNISRTHCAIAFEDGRFVLTDRSVNGVTINHGRKSTERNSRVTLNEGDSLALGNYVITVALADDLVAPGPGRGGLAGFGGSPARVANGPGPANAEALADPLRRPPTPQSAPPVSRIVPSRRGVDPFEVNRDFPSAPIERNSDRFDDIRPPRGGPEWRGPPTPDHAPATAQAIVPPRVIQPRKINFDDLIGELPGGAPRTPFSPSVSPPYVAPEPAYAEPPEPVPVRQPPPAAFTPDRAPSLEPTRDPAHDAGAGPLADYARDMAFQDGASHDMTPQDMASPEEQTLNPARGRGEPPPDAFVPDIRSEREPGGGPAHGPAASPTPGPSVQVPGLAQEPTHNARAALAAFLEGAGIPNERVDTNDPAATLRDAGKIFRAMTEGFQQVLKSRAAVKSDMGIEHTIISGSGNNALKFSVTADDAVRLLLSPGTAGYMDPLAAARQAATDIEAHELAVMAGMQQALLSLLHRFDPDELEKRLIAGRLDSLLPAARKARYWDAFRQTYNDLSREAEDEFQSVFGRPFAKAYNAQTRKD